MSGLAITIPARLREIRKARDMKLHELAKLMETTPQTVQRLETGNMTMSLEWLDVFCAALGVTPISLSPANPTAPLSTSALLRLLADKVEHLP